jgi:hypothetical protein
VHPVLLLVVLARAPGDVAVPSCLAFHAWRMPGDPELGMLKPMERSTNSGRIVQESRLRITRWS